MDEKLAMAAINAGIGGIIAALIIYLTYRLAGKLLTDVGSKMVDAFSRQATSMEGLTISIQKFVERDNGDHREMMVLLKFIAQSHVAVTRVIQEHDNCDHCGGSGQGETKE